MTREAAETMRAGQYVMHKASSPVCRPLRVTQVERTSTGRVMLRFATLGGAWCPATEYARPLVSWKADPIEGGWYTSRRDRRDGSEVRDYVRTSDLMAQWRAECPDAEVAA